MGGIFATKRRTLVEFKFSEFSDYRTIGAKVHVDDMTNPENAQYDMIMGTDLLESLGIDLLFSKKLATWDDLHIPMKNCGTIADRDSH